MGANLAVLFAHEGTEVLLVDADPQASALEWQHDRPAQLPQVSVIGRPAPHHHREIPRLQAKYPVILIDGGGRGRLSPGAKAARSP